jgi:hypothetical protein
MSMGVYIKGVEMPKSCGNCFYDTRCDNWRLRNWGAPPPDDCPLVPVPPHGDLIDRREAIIDANERAYDFWLSDDEVNATIQFLKEQPTIIPAEEGE